MTNSRYQPPKISVSSQVAAGEGRQLMVRAMRDVQDVARRKSPYDRGALVRSTVGEVTSVTPAGVQGRVGSDQDYAAAVYLGRRRGGVGRKNRTYRSKGGFVVRLSGAPRVGPVSGQQTIGEAAVEVLERKYGFKVRVVPPLRGNRGTKFGSPGGR